MKIHQSFEFFFIEISLDCFIAFFYLAMSLSSCHSLVSLCGFFILYSYEFIYITSLINMANPSFSPEQLAALQQRITEALQATLIPALLKMNLNPLPNPTPEPEPWHGTFMSADLSPASDLPRLQIYLRLQIYWRPQTYLQLQTYLRLQIYQQSQIYLQLQIYLRLHLYLRLQIDRKSVV